MPSEACPRESLRGWRPQTFAGEPLADPRETSGVQRVVRSLVNKSDATIAGRRRAHADRVVVLFFLPLLPETTALSSELSPLVSLAATVMPLNFGFWKGDWISRGVPPALDVIRTNRSFFLPTFLVNRAAVRRTGDDLVGVGVVVGVGVGV